MSEVSLIRLLWRSIRILERDHVFRIVGVLIMMVVAAALQAVAIGVVPLIVSSMQDGGANAATEKFERMRSFLNLESSPDTQTVVIVFLLIFIASKALVYGISVFKSSLSRQIELHISRIMYDKYLSTPANYYLDVNSSVVLRNITHEVPRGVSVFFTGMDVLLQFLQAAAILVLLVWVDPLIASLCALVAVALGVFALFATRNKSRGRGRVLQIEGGRLLKAVSQAIGGFKESRLYGREPAFYERFDSALSNMAHARHRHRVAMAAIPLGFEIAGLMAVGLLVSVIYLKAGNLDTALPLLSLFAVALWRALPYASSVAKGINAMLFASEALRIVVADAASTPREPNLGWIGERDADSRSRLAFNNEIRLENISYTYDNSERTALANVTLTIGKGRMIGFVGPTGSGKSTLINVLLGFMPPQSGKLTLDGADVLDRISDWRQLFGYVPQFVYLIDDSIRRNVAFGIPDHEVDDERVWHALSLAKIDGFVRSLDGGLDTEVGEHGVRLSGGERQRIGLARALYSRPQVLVLDEATSALDNATEKALMENIKQLREGHTILIVAHRLSTIRDCDVVHVLTNGGIADTGTYDELSGTSAAFNAIAALKDDPE